MVQFLIRSAVHVMRQLVLIISYCVEGRPSEHSQSRIITISLLKLLDNPVLLSIPSAPNAAISVKCPN